MNLFGILTINTLHFTIKLYCYAANLIQRNEILECMHTGTCLNYWNWKTTLMSAGFYFLLTLSDFYFLIALNWFALLSLHLIFFYIILDWIYVEYVRRFQISRIKMINTIIALSCSLFFLPLSWDNKRYIPVHVSMHVNLISQIQEPVHAVLFQYLQILFCLL